MRPRKTASPGPTHSHLTLRTRSAWEPRKRRESIRVEPIEIEQTRLERILLGERCMQLVERGPKLRAGAAHPEASMEELVGVRIMQQGQAFHESRELRFVDAENGVRIRAHEAPQHREAVFGRYNDAYPRGTAGLRWCDRCRAG